MSTARAEWDYINKELKSILVTVGKVSIVPSVSSTTWVCEQIIKVFVFDFANVN